MQPPPLNQTIWTLLIASLSAGAGWAMVFAASRLERDRQKRHNEWITEPKRGPLPKWARNIRSRLLP
jgi:hypothetical protein